MRRFSPVFFVFFLLLALLDAVSDQAIQKLEKRLNAYPSNLKLKYVLSRAYASRGTQNSRYYHKSILQLEEIVRVKQIPVVKFYLGLVHARRGDLDQAIYHWLTIVRSLKPNNLTTLRYLALALEKKGRHQESLKYWKKILSINPNDYKAHYHSALVFLRNLALKPSLRHASAIRHFEKVLAQYPKHKKTLWYLQLTYKGSKQYLKQRKVLKRLAALNPKIKALRKEVDQNSRNIQATPSSTQEPNRQAQAVSIATEITEDDFNDAFGKDPEPQEVPENHHPEPVEKNPTLPLDSPLSADAELLFNQGVAYLQSKEYDLALFNFLQAQELDPKFAQCYLQIGEVYLKLADSTPTEEKFKEHLNLSKEALKTASELEPESLLAHASRAKLNLVEQKDKEGFEKAHLKVARKAIQNQDIRFAVEEYIILITNHFLSLELIFSLSDILTRIDHGVRLDLDNVLQSLVSEALPGAIYLNARLRLSSDPKEALSILDRIFDKSQKTLPFFEALKNRVESSKGDFLDFFLLGRYLLDKRVYNPALAQFKKAAQEAPAVLDKGIIDHFLAKAKSGSSKGLFERTHLGNLATQRVAFEAFNREKAELLSAQPGFSSVFSSKANLGSILEKREFLETFLESSPSHGLGHYFLASILDQSSLEQVLEVAKGSREKSYSSHPFNADWHFKMGVLALRLGDDKSSTRFFKNSLRNIFRRGWEVSRFLAKEVANEASRAIAHNHLDLARKLIRSGFQFHPFSTDLAALEEDLLNAMKSSGTLERAEEFYESLLSRSIYSEVASADFGWTFFWALFLALLSFSCAIVFRKREELKHLADEMMGEKSLSIPVMTFLVGVLLILFPTGLVIFLPIFLWTFLDDFEQMTFVVGILVLIFIPFLFPVGYINNKEFLKAMLQMEDGEFVQARKLYRKRLQRNPADLDARFQLALIELNEGKGPSRSIGLFEEILQEEPSHFSALANLGVAHAKLGHFEKALQYLTQALNINPIHDKVLYNLSRVHAQKGDVKMASNYLKWTGGMGKTSKDGIDRLLAMGNQKDPLFAPVFLRERIEEHNTYFSPLYKNSLASGLVYFLMWFLVGGGAVGILLFLKDRMEILITSCRHCDARICSNCQSMLGGEGLCSSCFESTERRSLGIMHFRKMTEARTPTLARKLNFFLPGFSLLTRGKLLAGLLVAILFWGFLLYALFCPGYLWNQLFSFENSYTKILQWICFLASALIYGASSLSAHLFHKGP
jgi:tetratricopeptide (TPR) repeat protein